MPLEPRANLFETSFLEHLDFSLPSPHHLAEVVSFSKYRYLRSIGNTEILVSVTGLSSLWQKVRENDGRRTKPAA